eukprot:46538-Eustigmatos_ZCMA.PRE.1
MRAGGATDLWVSGCRPETIKRHGRWRSDTFLIYICDNIDVRRAEVVAAFATSVERLIQPST